MPDAGAALTRLRKRARRRAVVVRTWVWTTVAAAGAFAALLVAPASRACAQQPGQCLQRAFGVTAPARPVPVATPVQSESAPAAAPPKQPANLPATPADFKLLGSASAPVEIDLYLDYDCSPCGDFVRTIVPALMEQYVVPGKARLRYRDYPLPSHPYAALAARDADAAGRLGYYEVAMRQLFETRQLWDRNGEVDLQLAPVLPARAMAEVQRGLSDPHQDEEIAADSSAGQADHVDRTPFVVVVSGGKREAVMATPLTFGALKECLDRLPRCPQ